MSGVRVTGKVKFFNDEKGYGFIEPDNSGGEVFCKAENITRPQLDFGI
jgi:CspA family cold shock protein